MEPAYGKAGASLTRLVLLRFLQFPSSLHKVLLHAVVTVVTDSEHARFRADIAQICAVHAVGELKRTRWKPVSQSKERAEKLKSDAP